MDSTNYSLFNNCLNMTTNESELPLLDNNILNEINNETNLFEVDNFLSSVSSSNDSDTLPLPDLMSISQNCSFDSISIHNLTNQSNEQLNYDQYNSSASSSSDIYSPIQITPPETPPSCELTSQFNTDYKIKKTATNRTIRKSKIDQNLNKKKKLLPLAPKTEAVTFVRIINQQQEQLIDLKNLYNNNNTLNYNLNNQNVIINKMPIEQIDNHNSISNQQIINQQPDEKLSKDELSKIKEQARKLRNRQSAMASRQKKQDYVKSIEKKLEDLNDENHNLKKENIKLKEIINKLQFENKELKNLKDNKLINDCCKYRLDEKSTFKQNLFTSTDAKKAKKTICLLAVVFLIGLNMNLYNDNFKTYDSTTKRLSNSKSNNLFKGRVLLWTDDLDTNNNLNNTLNNTINCQNLISQNETLILESKLRNWAINQQSQQHNYLLNSNFDSNTNKLDGGRLPWYFNRNWNQIDENKIDQLKQKQIYNDELNYLINSVKPKDDTYYFLSLNPTDHLILPLNFYSNNSNNGKLRPKFSLLLPAMSTNSQFSTANSTTATNRNSFNQKNNANSILQLIEIDFEVINMKPIQILKNRLHLNNNARMIRRPVRNYETVQLKQTSQNQSKLNSKPLMVKSLLTRNQTNIVQSQIMSNNSKNRTIIGLN